MAVYHIEMNQMIDAKFRFSNFNVLCFVTLGYAFLLKSDLLPLHGESTVDVLRHKYDVFSYFVSFLSLLDFSRLLSVLIASCLALSFYP